MRKIAFAFLIFSLFLKTASTCDGDDCKDSKDSELSKKTTAAAVDIKDCIPFTKNLELILTLGSIACKHPGLTIVDVGLLGSRMNRYVKKQDESADSKEPKEINKAEQTSLLGSLASQHKAEKLENNNKDSIKKNVIDKRQHAEMTVFAIFIIIFIVALVGLMAFFLRSKTKRNQEILINDEGYMDYNDHFQVSSNDNIVYNKEAYGNAEHNMNRDINYNLQNNNNAVDVTDNNPNNNNNQLHVDTKKDVDVTAQQPAEPQIAMQHIESIEFPPLDNNFENNNNNYNNNNNNVPGANNNNVRL